MRACPLLSRPGGPTLLRVHSRPCCPCTCSDQTRGPPPHPAARLSPVVALLGQQLLELAQGDCAAPHQGPIGDGLPTEVVGHHNAVTRLGTPTARLPL